MAASQSGVEVLLGPLVQVFNLAVCSDIREFARTLLKRSIHQFKLQGSRVRVLERRDVKLGPLVGALVGVDDEVGEGFAKGPN